LAIRRSVDFAATAHSRYDFLQQFDTLREYFVAEPSNSCNVPFRLREAGYETEPNWLKSGKHDDTYQRLRAVDAALQEQWLLGVAGGLGRLHSRVKRRCSIPNCVERAPVFADLFRARMLS
jgi:hypothetical protein